MDRDQHKRYLEYRELFAYFGGKRQTVMTAEQFAARDADYAKLEAKGDARDATEQARFTELARVLFRD